MILSVIVVNYNAGPFLNRCLKSVLRHLAEVPYEICVVDNASADGSPQEAKKHFADGKWIQNPRNVGFAAALNQGLKATSGRYVLWLNPDAELLDGRLSELIKYLQENPRVGILGPKLISQDGRRQFSCRSFPSYRTALFHRTAWLTRCFPHNWGSRQYLHSDWQDQRIRETDWVSGACLLHRREVSDRLGGLDEQFFMYCEDVDFCYRAKQSGWQVQYHPASQVLHRSGASTQFARSEMLIQHHRSMWRYYRKHFRRNPLKDAVVGTSLWARCGFLMAREVSLARCAK